LVRHVARMEIRTAYRILVGRSEGKRQFRTRRSWENNIRNDLREIRQESMDWIHLDQVTD